MFFPDYIFFLSFKLERGNAATELVYWAEHELDFDVLWEEIVLMRKSENTTLVLCMTTTMQLVLAKVRIISLRLKMGHGLLQ